MPKDNDNLLKKPGISVKIEWPDEYLLPVITELYISRTSQWALAVMLTCAIALEFLSTFCLE